MRAHQIMTKPVITVTPETTIFEAANVMLRNHVCGLPVVDTSGKLAGIVSEGDFLRTGVKSEPSAGNVVGSALSFRAPRPGILSPSMAAGYRRS
jgi:CBS-domain-containing membrane protein